VTDPVAIHPVPVVSDRSVGVPLSRLLHRLTVAGSFGPPSQQSSSSSYGAVAPRDSPPPERPTDWGRGFPRRLVRGGRGRGMSERRRGGQRMVVRRLSIRSSSNCGTRVYGRHGEYSEASMRMVAGWKALGRRPPW
jgi:hypothetical protein